MLLAAGYLQKTANILTLAGHATITRIDRCLTRANSYCQRLGRQKDITNTYLYFVLLQSELLTKLTEQDNPISDAPVLYIDLSSYLS